MTIEVRSNDPVVTTETKAVTEENKNPAPAVNAEQKLKSTVSGTEETEEEVGDASESEHSEESTEPKNGEENNKPKKKGGFQRRINKLSAEKADAQREADYWKRLALEKEAGAKNPEKAALSKPHPEGKPNPNDYETHAEYVEAITDWKVDQREKTSRAESQKAQLLSEQEKLVRAHSERVKEFSQKTADFHEVLENVDDIPVSSAVEQLLLSSENGPQLMYELAKNREEFQRITGLPPLAAAREIGRIEAKLAKASESEKPAQKITTKAPKPIEPVGGSNGPVHKSPEDMTQAEYERWRRDQKKRKSA